MCPTTLEKKVLSAIGTNGVNEKVAHQNLGMSYNAVKNVKTRIVRRFEDDLDAILDYYPIFERRLKKRDEVLYTKLRRLARMIHNEG